MANNSITEMKQIMVVMSMEEEWSSLTSLLQEGFGNKEVSLRSSGPNQVCNATVGGRLIHLQCTALKEDMLEKGISQALDGCFKSSTPAINIFLLIIRGGHYTKNEQRMMESLQAHCGVEALKFLIILSLDVDAVVDVLDDALLELINVCDGRYCRITGFPATKDEFSGLVDMADYMLVENGASGYTEDMLREAKRRNTEDTAMKILKQKLQEAEEREQGFKQQFQQQEQNRAREMEELRRKHAEERKKETHEKRQHESKRESLEEAVRSHRATLQLQMTSNDVNVKKTSIVLLGLSGSGKSTAGNVILERLGKQYTSKEPCHEALQPTTVCERKEVLAEGMQLILVDTPELWDEDGVENLELVKDCLALSLPGPHVFLLVFQVGRFTQGESEMVGNLQKTFGREVLEHTVVLFTRCDDGQRGGQSIERYVAGAHASLRELICKCGSRYYALNVRNFLNALSYPQVKDLISGVNKLVASHGGGCYSTKRFSLDELKERKKMIRGHLI